MKLKLYLLLIFTSILPLSIAEAASAPSESIKPPQDMHCKVVSWGERIWKCDQPKDLYSIHLHDIPPEGDYSFHMRQANSLLNNIIQYSYIKGDLIIYLVTDSNDAVPDTKGGSWQKTSAEGYQCIGNASQCPWLIKEEDQDYIHTTDLTDKYAKAEGKAYKYKYYVGVYEDNQCRDLNKIQALPIKHEHAEIKMRLHGNRLAEMTGLKYTCAVEEYKCSPWGPGPNLRRITYRLLNNGKTYTGTDPSEQVVNCDQSNTNKK